MRLSLAALRLAARCLESIERNQGPIVDALRNEALAGVTCQTFENWKRNLEKARAAIALRPEDLEQAFRQGE